MNGLRKLQMCQGGTHHTAPMKMDGMRLIAHIGERKRPLSYEQFGATEVIYMSGSDHPVRRVPSGERLAAYISIFDFIYHAMGIRNKDHVSKRWYDFCARSPKFSKLSESWVFSDAKLPRTTQVMRPECIATVVASWNGIKMTKLRPHVAEIVSILDGSTAGNCNSNLSKILQENRQVSFKVGHLYTVTSPKVDLVKVGYATTTRLKLESRYKMVYGPDIELCMFPCTDCQPAEEYALSTLAPFHYFGELFLKTHLEKIIDVVKEAARCQEIE